MANTPFFARHGLNVNGFVTVNSTVVNVGSNVSITAATLSIGNSTANLLANSILVTVANSTGTLNLQPTQIVLGGSTVNTTAHLAGANVFIDTVKLSVGNSTVNLIANSVLVKVENATASLNLQATQVTLGTSVVNTTVFAAGANVILSTVNLNLGNSTVNSVTNSIAAVYSGAVTVNSTQVTVGANVFLSMSALSVGNSTVNTFANSSLLKVHNATGSANLGPTTLVIGSSTINATAYVAGANVFLDTTTLSVGNSTANLFANSITISLANSTSTVALRPIDVTVGTSVLNAAVVSIGGGASVVNTTSFITGANVSLDTVRLSIGNTIANLIANSIIVKVANATGIANLQPTQLVIGTSTVNSTAFAAGSNVFLNQSALSIGNSTVNVFANSSTIMINGTALSTATSGLPPGFVSIRVENLAGSVNTHVTFLKGKARDSTDATNIELSAASITKRIDQSWAVGDNSGGMDTGSVTTNSFYYLWIIKRSDTGVVDALFSTSATAPTMPANYDYKQRVGFVRTDASSRILPFKQDTVDLDEFRWTNSVFQDFLLSTTSPTQNTSLITVTATVPASSKAITKVFHTLGIAVPDPGPGPGPK